MQCHYRLAFMNDLGGISELLPETLETAPTVGITKVKATCSKSKDSHSFTQRDPPGVKPDSSVQIGVRPFPVHRFHVHAHELDSRPQQFTSPLLVTHFRRCHLQKQKPVSGR
jgi:hypothetical protein